MATLRRPDAILAVIKFSDGWRILPGDSTLAPYRSQAAAVREARHLLLWAELSGREVQLLVHDDFGELRKSAPAKAAGLLPREFVVARKGSRPEGLGRRSLPSCASPGAGGRERSAGSEFAAR